MSNCLDELRAVGMKNGTTIPQSDHVVFRFDRHHRSSRTLQFTFALQETRCSVLLELPLSTERPECRGIVILAFSRPRGLE